ncbi:MAG TPA: hypothetical protein DIC34_07930 [Treponema sp.]|nr:MAG: hypothetical protein A2001_00370 [Treponema sp. GWC1_61_84]HCM26453.1 hypothetical protein [Treponema sp.]
MKQFLTFLILGRTYAVDLARVESVLEGTTLKTAYGGPIHAIGAVRIGKESVQVIDAAWILGYGVTSPGPASAVVILSSFAAGRRRLVGILIDEMQEAILLDDTVSNGGDRIMHELAVDTLFSADVFPA